MAIEGTITTEGEPVTTTANRMFLARHEPAPRERFDADRGGIKVAVVEEHEIVRRGLVASLCEDGRLRVRAAVSGGSVAGDIDIAVVSPAAARRERFSCPIVVCVDDHQCLHSVTSGNEVVGVLHRNTLTGAQLRATVYAAAAGLGVNTQPTDATQQTLEPRYRLVLELMAEAARRARWLSG